MIRRTSLATICLAAALSAAACGRQPQREDGRLEAGPPAATADAAAADAPTEECSKLLGAMRSMRDGEQPCSSNDDCTVWHNGEYWDGCPPETNKENAGKLDAIRAEIEAARCPVETGANCGPRLVRQCVAGLCGGTPPFVMHLTDEQKAAYEAKKGKTQTLPLPAGAAPGGP